MSDYFLMRVHELNARAVAEALYHDIPFCEVDMDQKQLIDGLKGWPTLAEVCTWLVSAVVLVIIGVNL